MIPWTHPCPQPKSHIDRFGHFCRAHDCDRQIDRPTNRPRYSVCNRPHVVRRCGLIGLIIIETRMCPTWWPPCRIQVAPSVQRRKVWLTPTTGVPCSNAAKTRNPLKLAGCPKLPDRSQPLVGRSSPYYGGHLEEILPLNTFFRLSIRALVAKI